MGFCRSLLHFVTRGHQASHLRAYREVFNGKRLGHANRRAFWNVKECAMRKCRDVR
jgi:hypothetical protein